MVIVENNSELKIIHIASCKGCGRPMKDEWRFCPHCKTKVEMQACNCCSKEIKTNWRFCPFCKTEIRKGRKHRLVFEHGNKWLKELLGQ